MEWRTLTERSAGVNLTRTRQSRDKRSDVAEGSRKRRLSTTDAPPCEVEGRAGKLVQVHDAVWWGDFGGGLVANR
jgi:hypothetical protein